MNYKYFLTTLLALCMHIAGVTAQNVNRFYIPDLTAVAGEGRTVSVPFYMENTAEVVAVQFLLEVPEGCTLDVNSAQLTNRKQDHSVTIRKQQNGEYLCLLYSPTNKALLGRSGELFSVNMYVNSEFGEGTTHEFQLQDVVLSMRDGSNCLTSAETGVLTMQQGPDLYANQVTTDAISYAPGQSATISWQVQNIGGRATEAGWTEYISLKNANGTRTLLATQNYDNILAAGSSVSRQITIQLPKVLAMDGEAQFEVEVRPTSQTGESQGLRRNNTATSANVQLSKLLFLEYTTSPISEAYKQPVRLTLTRSGDRTEAETFSIQHAADSRITLPEEVTIPAGQSAIIFYLQLTDNDVLDDGNGDVNITINGNNYPQTTAQLVIEDNEYPDLTITASQTDINEGETFQLTITTSRPSDKDITVRLACENASRFTFPSMATIPANANSVTVDVTAKEDDLPSLELTTAFTANAASHNKGEVYVILHDDDIPALTLSLTPDKVSEGDGPVCVAATLRRTGKTDNKITVRLSDDTNGDIYYATGTKEIVMEKGTEVVNFNLGPVDNNLVDGDRVATITAAVFISSCSCNATGESAGVVASQLTITDNDGPTLKLTSAASTLKEGSQTTLTVTRNTATDEPLSVAIDCDQAGKLSFPSIVTIAAGATSATFDVVSTANATQGDSFTAVFTAQANGFSMGTTWLMVTDQTLPDARITRIEADKTEVEVGGEITLDITVANEGADVLPAGIGINVYSTTFQKSLYTSIDLGIGQTETLQTIITLPQSIGTVKYYAVVNEDDKVRELNKSNNTSSPITIRTTSPYTVSVQIEKTVYEPGEEVVISGNLTGANVAGKQVDVYVALGNARESMLTTADESGAFTTTWKPQSPMAGHFAVGACYPGENHTQGLCYFDVYGLRQVNNSTITCDVLQGETKTGSITFQNQSNLPLTDVHADVVSAPEGCNIEVNIAPQIDGQATTELNYSITGTTVTDENRWDEIKIRLTTSEGVSKLVSIWYYCRALQPLLQVSTTNIEATMTKGQTREYPLTITNVGGATTSAIKLLLPQWMDVANSDALAALDPGQAATILLQFTPTDAMQINSAVYGSLGIDYGAIDVAVVNYIITPVSEATGTLTVDVMDENTFYTNEKPHVKGASIVVQKPSGETVVNGTTYEDGTYSTEIPEGVYTLYVTAEGHTSKALTIIVDAGKETKKNVTISINNGVEIDYSLTRTTTEDHYEIVTNVTYKTDVPVPVVLLSGPSDINGSDMQVGEQKLLNFTFTNKGLINAENVYLDIPEASENWSMTALSPNGPFTLAPQTSQNVTVILTKLGEGKQNAPRWGLLKNAADELAEDMVYGAKSTFDRCMANMAYQYEWICGDDMQSNEAVMTFALATCSAGALAGALSNLISNLQMGGIGAGFGGGGTPNSTGGGSFTPKSQQNTYVASENMVTFCDPKDAECGMTLIKTMLKGESAAVKITSGLLDMTEDFKKIVKSKQEAIEKGESQDEVDRAYLKDKLEKAYKSAKEIVDKSKASLDANFGEADVVEEGKKKNKFLEFAKEAYEIAEKCEHTYNKLNPRQENGRGDVIQTIYDYAHLSVNTFEIGKELIGAKDWMELLEKHGKELIDYLETIDWETATVESVMENAPESIPLEKMEGIAQRIIKTHKEWLHLIERDFPMMPRRMASFEEEGIKDEDVQYDYIDLERLITLMEENAALEKKATDEGYESLADKFYEVFTAYQDFYNNPAEHVCATLKLEFKQELILAREAFEGTLTITNNNNSNPITNLRVNLTVTDERGNLATADIMDLRLKSNEGFEGETDRLDGTWSLESLTAGKAVVLFTPSMLAAPERPQNYLFGGTVSYTDPFTGLEVTHTLIPVQMQVNPTPQLELTYFLQDEIHGDDPLTEDVEPMEPAEFAVLINNIGYGEAQNVRMKTNQPTITLNEKGLNNKFQIISSQLNGNTKSIGIGEIDLTNFGDIPSKAATCAQWWFTSTYSGYFSEYDVTLKNLTYDNAKMSLVNLANPPIHTLIRSVKEADGRIAFLCDDNADLSKTPDMIYFSDGTTAGVAKVAASNIVQQSATEYVLTATPYIEGWNYGQITDPTFGRAKLIGITRMSDNQEINLRNFWQTDRTLRDGKDWLYENNLHFVDNFASSGESYLLTFEPRPEVELEVASFEGVPEESTILTDPLQTVTVTFNKPIEVETFTSDDITLNCQGKRVETPITITPISNTQFALDLSKATTENGYYVLTVQTAEITDMEGFNGAVGKSTSWVQYVKPVSLALSFYEAEVTYGDSFTEPKVIWEGQGEITYESENPRVASVDTNSGDVTINAVGTTVIGVHLAETPYTSAASTSYTLTILPPEGETEVTPGSPQMVSITIPDGKTMATYCSPYPLDFSSATMDCRAFIASMVNGDIIEFNEIHEAKGGVGMLLYGVPGTYEFPVKSCTEEPYNLFVGTLVPTYVERETDGRTNLGLKGTTFVPINAGVIKANKAYLSTEIEAGVKELKMAFNLWDGVRQVVVLPAEDDDWYTISGQHITKPTKRGLYIHGGKKVVIK